MMGGLLLHRYISLPFPLQRQLFVSYSNYFARHLHPDLPARRGHHHDLKKKHKIIKNLTFSRCWRTSCNQGAPLQKENLIIYHD